MCSLKKKRGFFERLEPRQMLLHMPFMPFPEPSHGHGSFIPPLPPNPTAAETAAYNLAESDLATVKTDQATVQTAAQAVQAAVQNALTSDPTVESAQTTLTAAITAVQTERATVQADWATVRTDKQAVYTAVQNALSNDPTVEAAQTAVTAAITAAQPAIQAAYAAIQAVYVADGPAIFAAQRQLWTDIRTGASASQIATDQATLTAAKAKLASDLVAPDAQLAAAVSACANCPSGIANRDQRRRRRRRGTNDPYGRPGDLGHGPSPVGHRRSDGPNGPDGIADRDQRRRRRRRGTSDPYGR